MIAEHNITDVLERIREAGIVGCGGAGFPTHVKLKGKFEYLIVNGAECEPLLRNDRWLMRNKSNEIVEAISSIKQQLQIPNAVIALKNHYQEEISALSKAISESGENIRLYELDSFYPAGDEQAIVYEVTGRVVPPAGLPSEVGAVVDNVATMYQIWHALQNHPFIWKYLTVNGDVAHPVILKVPIGTSIRKCIELAGGACRSDYSVLIGGPMMGRLVSKEELDQGVVTKTTSGILVLPTDGYHTTASNVNPRAMLNRARSACIQCTSCTQMCPRHLLGHPLQPHRIMRKMAVCTDFEAMLEDPVIRQAQLCCECGVCEVFACPMGLHPRKINVMIKQALGKAGIRYQRTETDWYPSPYREIRKIPAQRLTSRMNLNKYYDREITDLLCERTEEVHIPLKMHIGAPAQPVVAIGDNVSAGTIIAKPAEGKLGALVHASICGRVTSVDQNMIVITRE